MKKGKYTAYAKMYRNGRAVGRAYKIGSDDDESKLKRDVNKANSVWNRKVGKGEYVIKLHTIKSTTQRKRTRRSSGFGGFSFKPFKF